MHIDIKFGYSKSFHQFQIVRRFYCILFPHIAKKKYVVLTVYFTMLSKISLTSYGSFMGLRGGGGGGVQLPECFETANIRATMGLAVSKTC